jgi:hypothetical protein
MSFKAAYAPGSFESTYLPKMGELSTLELFSDGGDRLLSNPRGVLAYSLKLQDHAAITDGDERARYAKLAIDVLTAHTDAFPNAIGVWTFKLSSIANLHSLGIKQLTVRELASLEAQALAVERQFPFMYRPIDATARVIKLTRGCAAARDHILRGRTRLTVAAWNSGIERDLAHYMACSVKIVTGASATAATAPPVFLPVTK